jgi:two-component system chemotaxis sensor kinase CheA
VDSLVGEQEVVIKPLVDYLQENSGFSGATILGDGRISLILDVYELQKLAISKQAKKKSRNKSLFIPADNLQAENELSGIRQ